MQDCRKQVVQATIVTPTGQRFVGRNWIASDPGPVCPRVVEGCETGVGYHLCKDVCGQLGHAETVALGIAGSAAYGSTLYLEGHTYACDPCQEACKAAGIVEIIIAPPPKE